MTVQHVRQRRITRDENDGYARTGTQGAAAKAVSLVCYLPGGLDRRQCHPLLRDQDPLAGEPLVSSQAGPLWAPGYAAVSACFLVRPCFPRHRQSSGRSPGVPDALLKTGRLH